MDNDVVIAVIAVLPQLVLIAVGSVLLVRYKQPIGVFVASRVGSISAFGLRIELKPSEISTAVGLRAAAIGLAPGASPDPATAQRISDRAMRLAPRIVGRTILWVDDFPEGNRVERRLLNGMGVFVDIALSNAEARRVIEGGHATVDLIISDIKRAGTESGSELPGSLLGLANSPPLIFYIRNLDPALGTPAGAFGITNRPDVLLDLVMDALDRLPPRS